MVTAAALVYNNTVSKVHTHPTTVFFRRNAPSKMYILKHVVGLLRWQFIHPLVYSKIVDCFS